MDAMLKLVTDLGDAALLVPASILLLGYLLFRRSAQAAAAWFTALGLCAGLTILAKIAFYACGTEFASLLIRSPSGHTSFSTTFYCCGALVLSANREPPVRLAFLLASGAIVLAIAASRILLHAHTPEEVVAGLLIGLCCIAWFAFRHLHTNVPTLPLLPAAVVVLALAVVTHGRHIAVEDRIARLAQELPFIGRVCRLPESTVQGPPGAERGHIPAGGVAASTL
jgi:membrane-associated phospholipid phosphatase